MTKLRVHHSLWAMFRFIRVVKEHPVAATLISFAIFLLFTVPAWLATVWPAFVRDKTIPEWLSEQRWPWIARATYEWVSIGVFLVFAILAITLAVASFRRPPGTITVARIASWRNAIADVRIQALLATIATIGVGALFLLSSRATNEKVSIQVNGQSGTVTIRNGDPYFYAWRAIDQEFCRIASPFPSGSTAFGESSAVLPGEAYYYPTPGNPVLLKFACTDAEGTESTDEVTVTLAPEASSNAASSNSSVENRLAEIGSTLKNEDPEDPGAARRAATRAIEDIEKLELTTDNERVRAAHHSFYAHRILGDIITACRGLRSVAGIAAQTDYWRAIDGLDANFCFAVRGSGPQ